MTVKEIINQMIPLFEDVLDAEDIELTESTTAATIIEWDSLNHLQLLSAIEKHFNVNIPREEVDTYQNVGDMARGILIRLEKK